MANAKTKVINANIILYGPPRAGKTSNIQFIHRKLKPSQRGQIMPLSQDGYPQVAYEFLPIELGELKGYDTNLYIYTSPDHDDGLETRLNLLNEAAGVVFIADSSPDRMDDNIESLTNLKEELRYWGIDYDNFPLVFQYNKRDLPNALPRDEVALQLNPEGKESFEAIASAGQGVRDTFALISKMAVRRVRLKLVAEENDEELPESERRHPVDRSDGDRRLPPRRERSNMAPSEVTLDVAPPPRYDDDDDSEDQGREVDELEIDDGDRRNQENLAGAGVGEALTAAADDTTDHGVRARAQTPAPAESPTGVEASPTPQSPAEIEASPTPASPAVVEENQIDEEAQTVPMDKGKRSQKRGGGRKKDQVVSAEVKTAEPIEEPEAPSESVGAQAANRDDFLKTSFSFEEEPMMVATLEAGDAEDDDEEERDYHPLGGGMNDGLSKIMIPETPAIGAITFTGLADAEVNIQTYSEEEEEDEDEPVFRLGSRAAESEELQLEDEMEFDEAPLDDGATAEELIPDGSGMIEDLVDQDEAATSAGAIPVVTPLATPTVTPIATPVATPPQHGSGFLPPLSFEGGDEYDDEDRSIIASQEELDQVGMNSFGERIDASSLGGPPVSANTWSEDVESRSVVEDEDDAFIQSGRIDENLVDQLPPVGERAEGAEQSATEDAAGEERSSSDQGDARHGQAGLETSDASSAASAGHADERSAQDDSELASQGDEDDALPDMAIAPLEEEGEKDSVFEMMGEESVFEAVVSEPVVQMGTHTAGADGQPSPSAQEVTAARLESAVWASDTSDGAMAGGSEAARPVVTGWGEVTRVDAQTLLLPVTITLPGSSQAVQLSVTLKVDLMIEELLAAARAGRA